MKIKVEVEQMLMGKKKNVSSNRHFGYSLLKKIMPYAKYSFIKFLKTYKWSNNIIRIDILYLYNYNR